MRRYELETEREGSTVYFFIRDVETLDIVLLPTKYLMHKIRRKCSPNTVRRSALAILTVVVVSTTVLFSSSPST